MTATVPELSTPTLAEKGDGELAPPERGMAIGRFLVLEPLGMGAMGMVLSAYDPQLERKVAIKILRGDVWKDEEEGREVLVGEAQAMARLSHPNVVAVHEAVFTESSAYLVMEQVEGATLREWLRDRTRGWRQVLDVMLQAGAGLAAAHRAGLVHHDFKPDNVLVDEEGRPRVSDFGLAGAGTPGAGTRHYMAPEQLTYDRVDARADQYAFCVTLWEALHGERPGDATPARRRAPRWVYRALWRGLAARPEDRWPSLEALLEALRRGRSTRWRLAAVAAALVAASALAFALGQRASREPMCAEGERLLAGVWDAPRRQALRAAFLATGLPHAERAWMGASERIDVWARGWSAMHGEACRATRVDHTQSDTLLDLRMACLERRRGFLGSLGDVWAAGMDAAAVDAAVEAASRLPALAECADAEALAAAPRPAGGLASRVAAARRSVDAARALHLAGHMAEARRAAASARVEAEATGWPQALAEANFVDGEVQKRLQDPSAEARFVAAARLAEETRDDRLAARAVLELASTLADEPHRDLPRALLAADLVAGLVARLAGDDELRVRLLVVRGMVLSAQGDLAAARALLGAARAALRGGRDPLLVQVTGELAGLALKEHDLDGARTLAEEARELAIALHGPDHPRVANLLTNLGWIASERKDPAGAAALYRRALKIKERAGGGETAWTATTLMLLGNVEDDLGHFEEAGRLQARGLAIRERVLGPEHPLVASSLHNLGVNHRLRGQFVEAEAAYVRSLAIREKALGPAHDLVAHVLREIAWLADNRGQPAAAVAPFRRALAIYGQAGGEGLPATRASLAWVLAELGRCAEARPLSAAALADAEGIDRMWALVARARCDLAQGHLEEAVAGLEGAVAVVAREPVPVHRGIARAWLARALWAVDRRPAALAAARAALDELATTAEGTREASALRAWLAAR